MKAFAVIFVVALALVVACGPGAPTYTLAECNNKLATAFASTCADAGVVTADCTKIGGEKTARCVRFETTGVDACVSNVRAASCSSVGQVVCQMNCYNTP